MNKLKRSEIEYEIKCLAERKLVLLSAERHYSTLIANSKKERAFIDLKIRHFCRLYKKLGDDE